MEHYTALSPYLKRRFGCKVYKLSLSAGCTCPNRDGTLGARGCIFCSGSGEFAATGSASIPEQLEQAKYILGKKAQGAKFIAYFQDFTNTYGAVSRLEPLFLAAIEEGDVVALSIATRPDCLPEDILRMLSRLRARKPVFVELGLQTIHDNTAQYIRRGYPLSVFDDAVQKLHALDIEVIAHQILGLPGETAVMMSETSRYLGSVHVDGVKVLRGTDLAREYAEGRIHTLELDTYIDILEQCLAVLPPDVVIHRLTGDGAKRDLIAPLWSADKKRVLNAIQKRFEQDGVMQGSALRG